VYLRQSTAVEIAVGPFVDETDGFTAEIALALVQSDVRLKKASADWTQKAEATAPAHEESPTRTPSGTWSSPSTRPGPARFGASSS
jgi:hypothetical protein